MSILTLRDIIYSYAEAPAMYSMASIINLKRASSTPSSVVLGLVNLPCWGC